MFDGCVTAPWPLSHYMPLLSPDYVAHQIVEAMRYRKREVILPPQLGDMLHLEHFLPEFIGDYFIRQSDLSRIHTREAQAHENMHARQR